MKTLPIGVTAGGVLGPDNAMPDVDTAFHMVAEAGVFDYIERSPPPAELDAYASASARHGIAIRSGSFYYRMGRDEALLCWHLRIGRDLGCLTQNVQLMTHHADGHALSNDEVVAFYLYACEAGASVGVDPCLELHVNMWSEHLGRVRAVGEAVERRGVPFRMTLDHSHLIVKIDNAEEQAVQDLAADVARGAVVLDPADPACVAYEWLRRNWVRHAHARAAVPNGPRNIWMNSPAGRPGRAIQYPFLRPTEGEWHSAWDETRLEPWKRLARAILTHHAEDAASPLAHVSTEFIPFPDYGGGAKYSIFAQNVACARWLRETWEELAA